MSIIVTDQGFRPAADVTLPGLATLQSGGAEVITAIDLPADTDAASLPARIAPYLNGLRLIRLALPAFNDGRAFTLATLLRQAGYKGEIRALGPVIADQYPLLRRAGFDAAEIPEALAARQPWPQWQDTATRRTYDYRSRLMA